MTDVTLWDGNGLHVRAGFGQDGALVIQGQDLRGTGDYEYALTVRARDLLALATALGCGIAEVLPRLAAHGPAIVREGESAWLRARGVVARIWTHGDPPTGAPPLEETVIVTPGPPGPPGSPGSPVVEDGWRDADEDDDEDDEHDRQPWPADRFTLARAWWIAGRLARRHPGFLVSRVVDEEEQVPLLLLHDEPATTRVQFDLPAWIRLGEGVDEVLTWPEVFAQSDPLAVVRRIERTTALGAPREDSATSTSFTYELIACVLAAGLDSSSSWQALPVDLDINDPHSCDWDLIETFKGGRHVATRLMSKALQSARAGGPQVFHQPLWVMLRDLEPVALLALDGTVITSERSMNAWDRVVATGTSMTTITATLFGPLLP